ncbi:MAG: SDR family oxidoreductase [Planctomycetaceae bacterium]|nr:SDR family oxidoreductase [Planctomycetaceae bacterium]
MSKTREIFRDKVCVVTGAASGIGLQLSKDLLASGAIVYMADANKENLDKAHAELGDIKDHAVPFLVDVREEPRVRELIEQAAAHSGHLDYLFNNAGIGCTRPWEYLDLDMWKLVIDINLWGVVYALHTAIPIMKKQGFGHIITTSSIAALLTPAYQTAYSATKAAVTTISECLRFEMAHAGLNFTAVHPGNVATPIFKDLPAPPPDAVSVEEAGDDILDAVERKQAFLVFPEASRKLFDGVQRFPDERSDQFHRELADERRISYETKGSYY